MAEFGTPIAPADSGNSNQKIIIIVGVVAAVLLCCCLCALVAGFWLWNNGDALLEDMGALPWQMLLNI